MPLDKQNFNYSIPLSAPTLSSDSGLIVGDTVSSGSITTGKILYSANGTTYIPVSPSTVATPGALYQPTAPVNPAIGQIWIDSSSNNTSFDPNIIRRKTIVATGGQTAFTADLAFTDGYEQVFLNGSLLVRNTDYTTTNSIQVNLNTAAVVNDIVEIISVTNLNSVSGTTATTTTNTFTGPQTFTPSNAAIIPITVNGAFNQSADLLDVKTYSGNYAFSINGNGYISVGGSPAGLLGPKLIINNDTNGGVFQTYGNDTWFGWELDSYQPNGRYAGIVIASGRGTSTSPAPAQSGDRLGFLRFNGFNATGVQTQNASAEIQVNATANQTLTSGGSNMIFNTTTTGSQYYTEKMRIDGNGYVGINTVAPNKNLTVQGDYNFGVQRSWNLGQPTNVVTSNGTNWFTFKINMAAIYYRGFTFDVHMNGGQDFGGHGLVTYYAKMMINFSGTTNVFMHTIQEYSGSGLDGTGFLTYNSFSSSNDGTYLYVTMNYKETLSSSNGHRPFIHVITYDPQAYNDTSNTGANSQVNSIYVV